MQNGKQHIGLWMVAIAAIAATLAITIPEGNPNLDASGFFLISLINLAIGLALLFPHTKEGKPPKKKILIVSTDHDFIATIANGLRQMGYRVTTAPDFQMAHSIIRTYNFDLLIADLFVPYVATEDSASPLTKKIADIFPAEVPVIFMLDDNNTQDIKSDDEYIVKPFDLTALIEKIEKVL